MTGQQERFLKRCRISSVRKYNLPDNTKKNQQNEVFIKKPYGIIKILFVAEYGL